MVIPKELRLKMIDKLRDKLKRPLRLRERSNITTDNNLLNEVLLDETISLEKRVTKLENGRQ